MTRVFVVEDDAKVMRTVKRLLTFVGCDVVAQASTVNEAAEKLGDVICDVILSDHDFEDLDRTGGWLLGYASTRRPEIRRVLMSGRSATDSTIAALIGDKIAHAFWNKLDSPQDLKIAVCG